MMKVAPKGNKQVRTILSDYVEKIKTTGNIPVPFLLLAWPSWLGKIAVATELAKILLWEYYFNDSLVLYDYSEELEKPHTIKISSDEKIPLPNDEIFLDYGVREIHDWIVKSPAWKYKCLVLEDIERLTESASNALLKILEEPLENRLIIATTSQVSAILPTILSRALLFSFYPVGDEYLDSFIMEQPLLQGFDRGFLYSLAGWRVGILEKLLDKPDSLQALQKAYTMLVNAYPIALQPHKTQTEDTTAEKVHSSRKVPFEVYKAIQPVLQLWYEKFLLEAYMYYAAKQQNWDIVQLVKEILQLMNYAIKNEHIMYDFILRLDITTK